MREAAPRTLWQWLIVLLVVLYVGILMVAPMIAIVLGAFSRGWDMFVTQAMNPDLHTALWLTIKLALASAAINTVAGVLIAWVLVRHDFPGKRFFDSLVDLPFVVSPVIVGYVVVVLFGRGGWFGNLPIQIAFSWPAMLIVTVFVSIPFVIREVQPLLASLTLEQEEAAYTLGSSRLMTFWRIVMPGISRGIAYGIVLTLARSLGEFGAAAVAGGAIEGVTETATIYIHRAMHDRNPVGAYVASIILGLMSVGLLIVMNLFKRKDQRRES